MTNVNPLLNISCLSGHGDTPEINYSALNAHGTYPKSVFLSPPKKSFSFRASARPIYPIGRWVYIDIGFGFGFGFGIGLAIFAIKELWQI